MPMSRSRWYSRSVSVSAGATVIESPVCTPIGSRFSIEQTTTTLSLRSRISSSSYSFQPRIDSSSSTSVVGLACSPAPAIRRSSVSSWAMPGAGAAHRERRPHDDRVAELVGGGQALVHRVADHGCGPTRHRCAATICLELLAVLPRLDRLDVRADQLDAVLLEDARLVQRHRGVQRGLAAEGGEQRVRALLLDDLLDDLRGDRLDVGGVGELRVGHDRRRVGVDQDDPQALARAAPGRPGCRSSRTRRPGR